MIKLSRKDISDIIPNRLTVARSENYFLSNRVNIYDFDYESNTYIANVIGTKRYRVEIEFDRNGRFYDGDCSCAAFNGYNYCKHIGATLFELMSRPYRHKTYEKLEGHEARNLIDFFSFSDSDVKKNLILEINLEYVYHPFISDSEVSISFRMGEDKLYVVKSVRKLLEAIKSNNELYFGKQFSYEPDSHTFTKTDQDVINLLLDIHENEELLNDLAFYGKNQSLLSGKKIHMAERSLKKLFAIIRDRKINCTINEQLYNDLEIIEDDLDVQFTVTKAGQGLKLDIDFGKEVIPLVRDGEYLFAGDKIVKVGSYQRERLKPFYKGLDTQGKKSIKIPKAISERFVSEVYPIIKNIGSIEIDEVLEDSIYNPGLRSQVYLDKSDEKVIAHVKYVYGDVTIDAIDDSDKDSRIENKIILRDVEKERNIMSVFELHSFRVGKEGLYLDDEDKIFDFLNLGIKELQDTADLYYSEDFRTVKIKGPSTFSGGIKLNTKNDLLEFNFAVDGINTQDLKHVFDAIKEKKRYYRFNDGSFLSLENKELIDISTLWDYLDIDDDSIGEEGVLLPKYRALYIDDHLKELSIKGIRRNLRFKELVQNLKEPNDLDFEVPDSLKDILRDYQSFGFRWLKTLSMYGFGGILADDMGLGKTLQTLAFLLSERTAENRTSLIVAPSSLVYNWYSEVQKFTPEIKALVIVGNKMEREEMLESAGDYDLIITSYPLIRRDSELYEDIRFNCCILDEAQHIKNYQSQSAKSVKGINSRMKFALTGTPIENSLVELWSIFDFIMPGYLFSHGRFNSKFVKPIMKDSDIVSMNELSRYIRPFVLRRLKKDVLLELPSKIENKIVCRLTEDQKRVYLAYLQEIKGEIEDEIREKGFGRSHIKILAGLTRLRQICCHPQMFIENYEGDSGKLELAEELIDELVASGHRILLFSQFTSMLEIIKQKLIEKDISYKYLDGSTKIRDRGRLVKEFNNGEGDVFLISLKAGGTGLNLTGADTVIHFDPWWNPAVEDQATDRAHRIGQNKTVHVIKLVTKGTIEEKIFELQEKKKKLIEDVLKPGETLISKLSEDEIRSLFTHE